VLPARAFEVFTGEMGSWWDPRSSPDPDGYAGMVLEPRVGGTVGVRVGTSTYPWGSVTAWEPGIRYAQTFWLAMDPAFPSTLDVHFALAPQAGWQVRFDHGGWTDANLSQRATSPETGRASWTGTRPPPPPEHHCPTAGPSTPRPPPGTLGR
jgi:hypothetical protein